MDAGLKHTVLFVDDEPNILNSLCRIFRKEGLDILTAENGRQGLELINRNRVALVISDNRMPEMDGIEFLSHVKELSPDTVKIMLTGYADIKAVMEAINRDEVSRYITKPWNDHELVLAVRDGLERRGLVLQNRELLETTRRQNAELLDLNHNLELKVEAKTKTIRDNFFAFVRIFADLMELYDNSIGGHCKRVAAMATHLSTHMGFDRRETDLIEAAALLHTAGLVGVPRGLFEKEEDELTPNEKAILMHNPVLTQSLFSSIDTLRQVGILIRCHAERHDGGGYPDGLKGEEIPYGSRIIAACKVFDKAAHAKRSFTSPLNALTKEAGRSLDREVVSALIELVDTKRNVEKYVGIQLIELKKGMVLAEDLRTVEGRLLVPRGKTVSPELIDKIVKFNRLEEVVEPIKVLPFSPDGHGKVA